MAWYLGKPGALVSLPLPSRGTQTPYERLGATHQLLSGGRVRDSFGVKRSWQLDWQYLTRDQMGILDAFVYGATGRGPYVLLDPEQRNLLPLNVSTGTDTTGDATGFTRQLSGVVGSSLNASGNWNALGGPFPAGGTRTLLIQQQSGLSTSAALVTGPNVPVVKNLPYTLSAYISNDSSTTAGVYIEITWRDAASNPISVTTGNTIAATLVGRTIATGTAPATAVYASLVLRVGATTATGFSYADGFQFEQASGASAWVAGLSVPYVTVETSGRVRQLDNANDYTLTLVEV